LIAASECSIQTFTILIKNFKISAKEQKLGIILDFRALFLANGDGFEHLKKLQTLRALRGVIWTDKFE